MNPVTIIEITAAGILIVVVFTAAALLMPSKIKKYSLATAAGLTAFILLFFAVRPVWFNDQFAVNTKHLHR